MKLQIFFNLNGYLHPQMFQIKEIIDLQEMKEI
jgi:hypothetical protein